MCVNRINHHFMGSYKMTCEYVATVYMGEFDGESQWSKIQCANEVDHTGGHLIVVPKD